jgi:hypothetical protein
MSKILGYCKNKPQSDKDIIEFKKKSFID